MTGKLAAVREAPSDRVEASRQDMGGIDATFGRFTAVLEELGVEYAPERQRLNQDETRRNP